ncbi:hypothetical protein GCM10025865_03490 [Paraoerskovia sediminicola]|uniref:DUF2637 domain-containing protein n=1 Tax=Paraoerskovia sediminicola TaxID=1138587 RepID=A0ABM8FZD3_9CELL|nr:hypothetical protein [Paraoerskovia sediminicola]BDZ41050.1 hypothetical protein GCM10025865_03490 [Paraoerskovia sediminicola]
MTQIDPTSGPAANPTQVRYRGRHLPMVAVVVAAFIATALAYSGMVLFGLEVAGMQPAEAYALAGFLEVSLVAVALMARNAALEGRPYGVLLTLTWILSGTSGVFAALHEVAVASASTPYMVVFRFVPPLVAALMWHLALVGERHLVTGDTLDERRREHRVHQYVTALELWRDARLDNDGGRRGTQKVRSTHRDQLAARDRALKLLTVEDFERRMQIWVERLEAAERHGNRLDLIGATSEKRGTSRVASPATVAASSAAAPAAGVTESSDDVAPAAQAARPTGSGESREDGPQEQADAERPAVASDVDADVAADMNADMNTDGQVDATVEGKVDGTADETADKTPDAVVEAPVATPTAPVVPGATVGGTVAATLDGAEAREKEPAPAGRSLPATGHTRRVEMFGIGARPAGSSRPVPTWDENWDGSKTRAAAAGAEQPSRAGDELGELGELGEHVGHTAADERDRRGGSGADDAQADTDRELAPA